MDRLSRGIPAIQSYKEFHDGVEEFRDKTTNHSYLSDPKKTNVKRRNWGIPLWDLLPYFSLLNPSRNQNRDSLYVFTK